MLLGVAELEQKLTFARANIELLFNSEVCLLVPVLQSISVTVNKFISSQTLQLNIKKIFALRTPTRYRNLF